MTGLPGEVRGGLHESGRSIARPVRISAEEMPEKRETEGGKGDKKKKERRQAS